MENIPLFCLSSSPGSTRGKSPKRSTSSAHRRVLALRTSKPVALPALEKLLPSLPVSLSLPMASRAAPKGILTTTLFKAKASVSGCPFSPDKLGEATEGLQPRLAALAKAAESSQTPSERCFGATQHGTRPLGAPLIRDTCRGGKRKTSAPQSLRLRRATTGGSRLRRPRLWL